MKAGPVEKQAGLCATSGGVVGKAMMQNSAAEADGGEKLSLVERLGRTFDSLIKRDFGKRFYADTFLNELIDRRAAADAEMGKSFGLTMFLASIIVFFDLAQLGSNDLRR